MEKVSNVKINKQLQEEVKPRVGDFVILSRVFQCKPFTVRMRFERGNGEVVQMLEKWDEHREKFIEENRKQLES